MYYKYIYVLYISEPSNDVSNDGIRETFLCEIKTDQLRRYRVR